MKERSQSSLFRPITGISTRTVLEYLLINQQICSYLHTYTYIPALTFSLTADKTDRVDQSGIGNGSLQTLTTGQAAQICSVTRNAIFKWIQSGYLPARRTRGGHYRINRRDLDRVMATVKRSPVSEDDRSDFLFCWQYHSNNGVPHGCRSCAVYQVRAQRCFELYLVAPDALLPSVFCRGSCGQCSYFQAVHAQEVSVLVVSQDDEWVQHMRGEAEQNSFRLQFAACEYECCLFLSRFRPDFIMIDVRLGSKTTCHLLGHFAEDPRVPARVLVMGRKRSLPEHCEKKILGWTKLPKNISQVNQCIDRFWKKGRKIRRSSNQRSQQDGSQS